MVAVIVRHRVADYDAWKQVFDEHGESRRRHGAVGHHLYRDSSDPQGVIIVNQFKDLAGAKAFSADPSLPEAMKRAGVISDPDIAFAEQVEAADYQIPVA